MKTHDIIQAFGGRPAIAAIADTTAVCVTQWHRNGIPAKHWPRLVEHARAKRIAGITFDVLRATKPERRP